MSTATVTVAEAIANLKARGTVHHAHREGRTVAFRRQEDGRFENTYSDGVVHRDLNEAEAQIMAECWLGEPTAPTPTPAAPAKPTTPAKKASIALGRGWSVALRRDEVFPHDPGQGCPAVVCGPFGKQSTFWCASDTGDVECPREGTVEIPAHILRAIHSAKVEDAVAAYLREVEEWLARKAA